jgi:hypothetical protein
MRVALAVSTLCVQVAYANNQLALVDTLGLFGFDTANTLPDDGETCIVLTAGGGGWVLECPHWEFINSNLLLEDWSKDIETRFTNFSNRIFEWVFRYIPSATTTLDALMVIQLSM